MNLKSKIINQSGVGAVFLLILLSIVAGSVVFLKKNSARPKATPGVPILLFSEVPAHVGSGQDFDLILKVNPNGAEFHAFELYSRYDPLNVEFQDSVNLSANITSPYSLIVSSIDTVDPTISIIGTQTGNPFAGNEDIEIARVKMKKKTDIKGDINFSWGEGTKLGNNLQIEKLNKQF